MHRRTFIEQCSAAAAAIGLTDPRPLAPADVTLTIAPLRLELAPGKSVRTRAYNGTVPGPLLRLPEGEPVTVEVVNDSDQEEFVHWHGLHIPADVDGAADQGTPPVPAHGRTRYTFTPRPVGTRWYHSHTFAGRDLDKSTYTGQFGFLLVTSRDDPGRHDQELFLALHDWDPYFTGGDDGFQNVGYKYASINGRMLGAADPIRVREGERVLMHFVNASASEQHWIALPGHRFTVLALDGNVVPRQATVDQLRLDPGERVDAMVEMSAPGVWTLGEPRQDFHRAGMGIVVEYAGKSGAPQWRASEAIQWSYLDFAAPPRANATDAEVIPMVFRSVFHGHGALEGWSINGKSFPHTDTIWLTAGRRYRLAFDNQSDEDHPVHLHRHTFELVRMAGVATSGVRKDVLLVPARGKAEVEVLANNPGKTMFHCHLQDHMDAGFMMMFDYR